MTDPTGPTGPTDPSDPTGRDLLDERMDRRLRDSGDRWRERLPEAAEPTPIQRRRRDWISVAATVALLVGVGVGYTVLQHDDQERDGTATDPATSIPEPSTTVRPAPSACGLDDLVAAPNRYEGAAGTSYLTVTLELAPDVEPCTVEGYPAVVVLDNGVPSPVETVPDRTLGYPRELTVLPDRPVQVTLGWAVSHYCGQVSNDALRLRIAHDLDVAVDGFGTTTCSPGEGRPPVRVGAYAYVDPATAEGTVNGVVALNDGPGPGTGEFVTSGDITFDDESVGGGTSIGTDGSYQLRLPAGDYHVTVSTPQWNGGQPYDAGSFTVVGGELNELNVVLPLR